MFVVPAFCGQALKQISLGAKGFFDLLV